MIEYLGWARGQLNPDHKPSLYDWQNMKLAEMADRALAICAEADKTSDPDTHLWAFQCLEKMAKAIKEKYPHPKPRGW